MRTIPFLLVIDLVFLLSGCNSQQENQKSPPNIIFIMSDDHAYQAISAYRDSEELDKKYIDLTTQK